MIGVVFNWASTAVSGILTHPADGEPASLSHPCRGCRVTWALCGLPTGDDEFLSEADRQLIGSDAVRVQVE